MLQKWDMDLTSKIRTDFLKFIYDYSYLIRRDIGEFHEKKQDFFASLPEDLVFNSGY